MKRYVVIFTKCGVNNNNALGFTTTDKDVFYRFISDENINIIGYCTLDTDNVTDYLPTITKMFNDYMMNNGSSVKLEFETNINFIYYYNDVNIVYSAYANGQFVISDRFSNNVAISENAEFANVRDCLFYQLGITTTYQGDGVYKFEFGDFKPEFDMMTK